MAKAAPARRVPRTAAATGALRCAHTATQSPGPTHQRFQNQIITLFRSDTLLRNVTPPSNDLDLADLPNG